MICGATTQRVKKRGGRRVLFPLTPGQEWKKLDQEAMGLWAQIQYRKAVAGRCAKCGRARPLQAAHFVPRERPQTRHDPENGAPLCAGCHMEVDRGDREAAALWWRSRLGEQAYERLRVLANVRGKRPDIKLRIIQLRSILEAA